MDDTQAALRAALQYVRRGWRVFPCWWTDGSHCACGIPTCDNPGKHPLAAAVPSGCLDASADGAAVRAWWFALPRANVAIATGPTSGIWVLDIDREAAGFETLAALEARHGALPDTATVITGGLGEHRYFAYPAEEVPSRAGIAPGLDTRGAGGYVVAPPSRHESGRRYTWSLGYSPAEIRFAAAPTWLLELARRSDEATARTNGRPVDLGAELVIVPGARNHQLTRLGGLLRRYGLNARALAGCLAAINAVHCVPPLGEEEVVKIAQSLTRYAPGPFPPFQPSQPSDTRRDDLIVAALRGAR